MTILPRWWKRPTILRADNPKGPWGGGGSGGGEPRNPWAMPPGGRRGPAPRPTALDEFLRKARGGGGGGGGGFGGGMPGLPGGANARTLWGIGVGVIALMWILFTSIHQIGPQQRGVLSYFGRYAGTLEPGLQVTWPAPIARVQEVDVQRFRTENFPRGDGANLTLTGDQNIVDLTYSVRWNVGNARDYVYQLAEPEETVRAAAESAMRAVVATTTLDQALGAGRTTIEARVNELTQAILASYGSGVRIQGVSINRAAAPQQIVDDFNKVTAAQQEAVAAVNGARGYAQQVVARAQGEAAQFDRVYDQYRLAPEVTRRRMYYETMEAVLAKSDKTIVEPTNVVPYLNAPNTRRVDEPVVPPATPAQPQAGGGAVTALFRNPVAIGIAALFLVLLAGATFTVVPETRQAVIYRLAQPIRVINRYQPGQQPGNSEAGLIARVPFLDSVRWVDKRVRNLDLENTQVLSTDQLRLNVDAFARYRVVDPRLMVVTAGSEEGVENQLRPLFGSTLRNELGKVPFTALLSPERTELMDSIQDALDRRARQYGVQIVDVRIKEAELPEGTPLESALRRMQTARQQEAITITAEGQRQAQVVRADADAEASRIYAQSFGRDAGFYDFYRAMQSYRRTFGADGSTEPRGSTSIILSPNNAYLREFQGRSR